MRIRDVLKGKGSDAVVTVPPGASVRELIGLLAQHNVGALIVSGDGNAIEGIVSERDVVRRLHADEAVLERPVSEIMTALVQTCSPDDSGEAMLAAMTQHRIRHVPVLEGERLAGIISIGDVVKHRIDELEFERDQLDQYLHQT